MRRCTVGKGFQSSWCPEDIRNMLGLHIACTEASAEGKGGLATGRRHRQMHNGGMLARRASFVTCTPLVAF